MLFGSFCVEESSISLLRRSSAQHMLPSHHMCHNRKCFCWPAAGSSSLETWAVIPPGQAWGRISGGVLSPVSSHLQACIFRRVQIGLLICCLWQWVWPCLLLALISGDFAHGDGGGASSLGILLQLPYPSPCVL